MHDFWANAMFQAQEDHLPMRTQFPIVLAALLTVGILHTAGAKDKVEIKSGVSGSYCVPFDSPQCRSFNTMEADRVFGEAAARAANRGLGAARAAAGT